MEGLFAENPPIHIIAQKDVRAFLLSQFRTPEMRAAAEKPGNWVGDIVEEISKYPLFTSKPSTHPASPANFTPYFRILTERNYADPLRGDLYILHELVHMGKMPYDPNFTYEEWAYKLIENEKLASFVSEVLIHFQLPGIRAKLDIPVIWADQFLDGYNRESYEKDPGFVEFLYQKFKSIGKGRFPKDDPIEARSWIYDRSNEVYASIFWEYAPEIEAHMASFYKLAKTEPDRAIKEHLEWIAKVQADGLIYPDPTIEHFNLYGEKLQLLRYNLSLGNVPTEIERMLLRLDSLAEREMIAEGAGLQSKRNLLGLGIAKVVYALPFPETRDITERVWNTTKFDDLFSEPYTSRQDGMHLSFENSYRNWSAPVLKGLDQFKHSHPAAGSAEAIKDVLSVLNGNNRDITLHMFEGDYEGITAYATAMGLKIVKHPRTDETIKNLSKLMKKGDAFYISQPSAIDGNVWPEYDRFMKATQKVGARVLVDLAYVGTVARGYNIDVSYSNIEAVFFSLSKAFGVYYQRIGGVFVKEPIKLLQGNVWTKNLISLKIGMELMDSHGVYELPRTYQWAQNVAINHFNLSHPKFSIKPSDVILLGFSQIDHGALPTPELNSIVRGSPGVSYFRPNLTPLMIQLVEGAQHEWALEKKGGKRPSNMDSWSCRSSLKGAAGGVVNTATSNVRAYGRYPGAARPQ